MQRFRKLDATEFLQCFLTGFTASNNALKHYAVEEAHRHSYLVQRIKAESKRGVSAVVCLLFLRIISLKFVIHYLRKGNFWH